MPPVAIGDTGGAERVLVVVAHPDDVDFGAGGTVASWTAAGTEVAYCIVTDGDAGGSDRSISRAEMAVIRRREQTEAAAVLGVHDLTFLGYPDGRVTPSLDLRRDITRVVRRFRPDRLVTQSPERNWQRIAASHPDHMAAGEAAACAVYPDARNPFAHPELLEEGLEPHTVRELWLMGVAPSPGIPREDLVAIDVTDTFDKKLEALKCHASQVGTGDDTGEDLEKMLRAWLGGAAMAAGLPDGRLAELFRVAITA
ncbi:MAG: PIG-L deacetylase family protein [Acidimicrobiales bacterium]|nr:PIG-L family deacetylase [Actinomycetota bacterium]